MPLGEDTAEELIALYTALGAVNLINAIGSVTTTAANNLPQPTAQAINTATLGVAGASFVLPAPSGVGSKLRLVLTQDGTGSRTATISTSSGALTWVGAAAPTLTTTAARVDILEFESFDGTNWVGSSKLNVH
jgi:hypothetical protein